MKIPVVCPPFPGARFAAAVNRYATTNCVGSGKCGELAIDSDISRTRAGTRVIHQQCPTVYACPTAVKVIAGKVHVPIPSFVMAIPHRSISALSDIAAY